jgi:hypothetical protein
VSPARERRLLDDQLIVANAHLSTVAAAILDGGSEPLLWARMAAENYVRALEAAKARHENVFGELTPIAIPTRQSSSSFQAVGKILDDAKKNPMRGEP